MLQDKIIICKDCGGEFTFTVEQQEFYIKNNLPGVPSRCPGCRNAAKNQVLQEPYGINPSGQRILAGSAASCSS